MPLLARHCWRSASILAADNRNYLLRHRVITDETLTLSWVLGTPSISSSASQRPLVRQEGVQGLRKDRGELDICQPRQ